MARKKIKGRAYKYTVENGSELLTLNEVADRIGKTRRVINEWYHKYECRTLQDFFDHLETYKAKIYASRKGKKYPTCRGNLRATEIRDIIKEETGCLVGVPTIMQRLRKLPVNSPEVFFRLAKNSQDYKNMLFERGIITKEELHTARQYTANRRKSLPFNRSVVCYRHSHTERCKHYIEMLDEIVFKGKVMHPCEVANDKHGCANYNGEMVKPVRIGLAL